ncbi:MAG: DUF11 domain-containing protein, partial [Anaerolineales bacterium]
MRGMTPTTSGAPPDLVPAGDGYSLEPGETMTVTFAVTVDDPLGSGISDIVNTAEVDCTELDPSSDTVTDTLSLPEADLSLAKGVDDGTPNVGQDVVFDVVLTNGGPDSATSMRVEDVLPGGLNYVSSSATQGSYSSVTDLWTVGTMANGASETLYITATVSAAGIYTNTAQVERSDQYDPDSTPDND